jgi:hypothetical protein
VEDEGGGKSKIVHDDAPSADILACFAAKHPEFLKKKLVSSGGMVGYSLPSIVIGNVSYASSLSSPQPRQTAAQVMSNRAQPKGMMDADQSGMSLGSGDSLSAYLGVNVRK